MAFRCPVPAQESAVRYVDEAADAIDGQLLCGGHSKGGNLAVYGAAMCSDVARERIERAYSHDGPGFVEEFLNGNAFADLSDRIDKTLPRSSIFGMMFETQEDYAIVEAPSSACCSTIPFSWVVDGHDFVYCERLSAGARYVDGSIREMLLAVSPSERERFVDALFSVFEATGAERFADIAGNLRESLPVMLQAAQGFDKDTRRFVSQTIVAILKCALLPKRPQIDVPAAGKRLGRTARGLAVRAPALAIGAKQPVPDAPIFDAPGAGSTAILVRAEIDLERNAVYENQSRDSAYPGL